MGTTDGVVIGRFAGFGPVGRTRGGGLGRSAGGRQPRRPPPAPKVVHSALGPASLRPLLTVAVLAIGCGPSVPAGWDVAAAEAFQAEHRKGLAAEMSPLAAVSSDYLGPGQARTLRRRDTAVVSTEAEGGEDPVQLRVDEVFRCLSGCKGRTTLGADGAIKAPVTLPWGPLRLVLSPQPTAAGPGGRVLVFDAAAPALQGAGGVEFAPAQARWIVPARFDETRPAQAVPLSTTRGLQKPFEWVGVFSFEVNGVAASLRGYRMAGKTSGPLLVPFTDATNGDSSYPVGRYVEVEVEAGGQSAVVDFNRATNPWCAYSPHFNCPVPPKENALAFAVPAGELAFSGGEVEDEAAASAHGP